MTARERRLLYAFSAILLIALSWFVLNWRGRELRTANFAKAEAQAKLDTGKLRIEMTRAELEAKREWLVSRRVDSLTLADASSELLNRAQNAALTAGLQIDDEKFLNLIDGVEFDQARMSGKLQGKEQAVYAALIAFHDPNRLQVIRELRVQPHPKLKEQIIATVEFRLYYRAVAAGAESSAVVSTEAPEEK